MAHFAEIKLQTDPSGFTSNQLWVVQRVVVVGDDIPTAAGPLGENPMHVDGETWCVNFFKGGTWKECSITDSFRKRYTGPGATYDESRDAFINPQPYASWTLNVDHDWEAPITYPSVEMFDHPSDTYVEGDDIPEGSSIGSPRKVRYDISWNESLYQSDNTKGWQSTKDTDTSESPTIFNWNGTDWVSS
tara:strand:- start:1588 stop:2154 length:567 start_codon:yes stop_codon:yes gene_type:complete